MFIESAQSVFFVPCMTYARVSCVRVIVAHLSFQRNWTMLAKLDQSDKDELSY